MHSRVKQSVVSVCQSVSVSVVKCRLYASYYMGLSAFIGNDEAQNLFYLRSFRLVSLSLMIRIMPFIKLTFYTPPTEIAVCACVW